MYYYVKYNNIEGWYYNRPLEIAQVYSEDFIVNASEDNEIYELPDINSKILNELKKDDEYQVIAISTNDDLNENIYESWSYISYKNIKGWIHSYEQGPKEDSNKKTEENSIINLKNNPKLHITFITSVVLIISFIIYSIVKMERIKN